VASDSNGSDSRGGDSREKTSSPPNAVSSPWIPKNQGLVRGANYTTAAKSEELLGLLRAKFSNQLLEHSLELGDAVVRVSREDLPTVLELLKIDTQLSFDFFVNVTAVDWVDQKPQARFELVYHLMSLRNAFRLRLKVWVPESDPTVNSATALWPGADFMEREVWDMYGISFTGHPNLRRILMYDEFVGHPLRKDYPVQAKQPRVPLRSPEVRNTAVDLRRPTLVQIQPRKAV
jgi:NADH-quinone oxidoreductase subunit C